MSQVKVKKEPPHVAELRSNLDEIRRLLDIRHEISTSSPGYRPDVQVLNKSAIVLLVATWEAFVEDLARASFDFLFNECDSPDMFPSKVLIGASESLIRSENKKDVWKLSGDGWTQVLGNHKDKVLDRYIGKLNTPRQTQVDDLFYTLLGLKGISKSWHWKGMSHKKAVESLSNLITLRGSIAHRVRTTKSVTKTEVQRSVSLCMRLSVISSNACAIHLRKITGKYPWNRFTWGSTG